MFAAKITSAGSRIYIVANKAGPLPMYFYVLVERVKEQAFLKQLKGSGMFNINDFGQTLESGIGLQPSDKSIEKMKKTHGFETKLANN